MLNPMYRLATSGVELLDYSAGRPSGHEMNRCLPLIQEVWPRGRLVACSAQG
jgi:hypothetical protein